MDHGVIEVTASYPGFAFIYALFRPTIEIDDRCEKRSWGTSTFDVAPGRHVVAVSYPWLFSRRCGRNSVEIDVRAGETVHVRYAARSVRYVPGTITVDELIPTARVVT